LHPCRNGVPPPSSSPTSWKSSTWSFETYAWPPTARYPATVIA
jgi:hypothetical protein